MSPCTPGIAQHRTAKRLKQRLTSAREATLPKTIRYDRRTQTLHFGTTEREHHDLGYVLHRSELSAIKAADHRVAMMNLIDAWSSDGHPSNVSMYISDEDLGESDDANPRPRPIEFKVSDGSLIVTAEISADTGEDPFEPPIEMFTGILQHYLRRHRATLRHMSTAERETCLRVHVHSEM